jgi:beta-lactamase superfamily II metal-dependent hydrolase
VPQWGIPYVNYAYNAGLTKGIGNGLFGASQTMDAKSYHTFLLRALGYNDSEGNFSWSSASQFAHQIGLLDTGYYADISTNTFLRNHMAKSSYDALNFNMKGSQERLADTLIESGYINEAFSGSTFEENYLEIHFLDVGQALCILVEDNAGNQLLYDAGNNGDGDFIVSYLESEGVDDIEYLINSHPHEDHIGGMDDVLHAFDVEQVILSGKTYDTKSYDEVIALISQQGIPISYPEAGTEYQMGGWTFEVLGPMGSDYSNVNNYSLVVKVSYGETDVLLTGDAEILSELEMIASDADLEAEILQVGHHGDALSTSSQLLREMEPAFAVISVGEGNSYGYPDDAVQMRLEGLGIETYRTDVDGTVVFTLLDSAISVGSMTEIGNPDPAVTDRPEME